MGNVTSINSKKIMRGEISETFYSILLDNVSDGMSIVNASGVIEYVNASYERMFSVNDTTILGKNIHQIEGSDIIKRVLRSKNSIVGYLESNHRGNKIKINVSASPFYIEEKLIGVISIYRMELGDLKFNHQDNVMELPITGNKEKIQLNEYFSQLAGENDWFRKSLQTAQKAAKLNSTILITGESGTGKELVASGIHYSSDLNHGPFVKINCGAIPANLLESELFGHEQGSFTGAIRRKIGKFEQANGGTIFLDEIGDMPIDMQVKLLRVLQEKEFERIGGIETIKVNVRVIAATHRNLDELIEKGKFREDLFYRLNVIPIYIPSLRERKEDIKTLCNYFLEKICHKLGKRIKGISEEVFDTFYEYNWPGNVRELENLMERIIALTDNEIITFSDIPSYISNTYEIINNSDDCHSLINMKTTGHMASLEEYEKEIIREAIERFGSFNAASKVLGITHKTVATKARKYNIVDY